MSDQTHKTQAYEAIVRRVGQMVSVKSTVTSEEYRHDADVCRKMLLGLLEESVIPREQRDSIRRQLVIFAEMARNDDDGEAYEEILHTALEIMK